MKVFISWSGELSRNIAEVFRQWLPSVIQATKPYYTPSDIDKGSRWNTDIAKELSEAKIGLICLTPDNLESPWIMFEAGALTKNIESSKVVPILFHIDPSDIKGPLVQFQASKYNKAEMKKVVEMINKELGDNGLDTEVLNQVFEKWYPELEEKIEVALNNYYTSDDEEIRSDSDILKEVLSLVREISIHQIEFNSEKENQLRTDFLKMNINSIKAMKEIHDLLETYDKPMKIDGGLDVDSFLSGSTKKQQ